MSNGRVIDVLCALAREPDGRGDADLVHAFCAQRSEVAFAELLRRHGPAVFGVCRRILGQSHDAEDAFQAVFLVLARRAQAIQPPALVGNWLYGVAVRTALKARAMTVKRNQRQRAAARNEAVEDIRDEPDLRRIIDEELACLAQKYRVVIVMCDMHGQSRSAAAQSLGWPEGTVAARLRKARQMLASRLARRGVTASVAGCGLLLGSEATATVPVSLSAATMVMAGGSAAVPPTIQSLAEAVMRTMILAKLKFPVVLLLACGLTVAVLFAAGPRSDRPAPVKLPEQPAPAEAKPALGTWSLRTTLDHPGWLTGSVAYSPNGKQLLVGGNGGNVRAYETAGYTQIWELKDDNVHAAAVAYSVDGKQIAVTVADGIQFLDAATGKKGDMIEEKDGKPNVVAFFRDTVRAEAELATQRVIFGNDHGYFVKIWTSFPNVSTIKSSTMSPEQPVADSFAVPLAVDPQGKRAVVTGPIDQATGKNVLWAWSAGSGAGNRLLEGHAALVVSAAWSADGKTIVTGDAAGTVIRWDGANFMELSRLTLPGRVAAIAVTSDSGLIAAAAIVPEKGTENYAEAVFVWSAANPPVKPEPLSKTRAGGPFTGQAGLAFAPDGKSLAAAFCNHVHLNRLGELIGKTRIWEWSAKP